MHTRVTELHSPALTPAPGDLAELTSLRFFAALIVLTYHYAETFAPELRSASGIIAKGYLGVDFFFVLSGFILTHVYLDAARDGRFSYADFLWARFARIYPLHLVTMAAAMVVLTIAFQLGHIAHDPVYLKVVLANAGLVHAWGVMDHFSLNAPSWSISAEWADYLLFPVFLVLTRAGRPRPGLFLTIAIVVFLAAWQGAERIFAKPLTELTYDGGALRILPSFLVGCALCTLAGRLQPARETTLIGLVSSSIGVLVLMHVAASDLLIIAAMAATILFAALCARADDGDNTPWLAARPLVYLGEVSFAIYMTHRVVETVLTQIIAPLLGWGAQSAGAMALLALAATLLVSMALYHTVERPARTLLRRLPPSQWGGNWTLRRQTQHGSPADRRPPYDHAARNTPDHGA